MPGPYRRGAPGGPRLAWLDALAAELTARGWTAYLTAPPGGGSPACSCRTPTTGGCARMS